MSGRPKDERAGEHVGADFPFLYGEDLPTVDARFVSRIAGFANTTINAWINRGFIPGVTIGSQGRARSFDPSLVFHLAVISALVRLNYSASVASNAAIQAAVHGPDPRQPGAKLIVTPAPIHDLGSAPGMQQVHTLKAETALEFDAAIKNLPGGKPESYVVVDLSAIWDRVYRAIKASNSRE